MSLSKQEIQSLFNASVDNSMELFQASIHLAFNYDKKKFPSLGIAELALEELGKSFSLLAIYSTADENTDWNQFWKDWRNHDLKASRAFFYEFFCTLRLVLSSKVRDEENNPIPRGKFSIEKELAFYVDFNKNNRTVHVPGRDISDEECQARAASLVGLLNPALTIKDWINSDKPESFKNAISDYANFVIRNDVYTQNVKEILDQLRNHDEDYTAALDQIWELFNTDAEKMDAHQK